MATNLPKTNKHDNSRRRHHLNKVDEKGKKTESRYHGGRPDRKEIKRLDAKARQADYDKLTIDQKLNKPGLGEKERQKLLKKRTQVATPRPTKKAG